VLTMVKGGKLGHRTNMKLIGIKGYEQDLKLLYLTMLGDIWSLSGSIKCHYEVFSTSRMGLKALTMVR